jgi:redox-sensitive bicupin YhaK (pirin superfamily)
MLGLQIWLNLPQKEKMAHPIYFDITKEMIKFVKKDFGEVRIIAGTYDGKTGVDPSFIKATLIDFLVNPGKTAVIPTIKGETAFVFLIEGDAISNGDRYDEKTAILYGPDGDSIEVTAPKDAPVRLLFFQGKPLQEPVAWGGPIVMNTEKELQNAFQELNDGTFIKHNAKEAAN